MDVYLWLHGGVFQSPLTATTKSATTKYLMLVCMRHCRPHLLARFVGRSQGESAQGSDDEEAEHIASLHHIIGGAGRGGGHSSLRRE
jgi:hypothetical protein